MARRVKLAIVGCGAVAINDYFPALEKDHIRERVELLAVCDVASERARSVAERYGAPEVWTDYGEMVAGTAAEAIMLLTPIPFHYKQGMAAIEKGKHIYIQKTITTTYEEAAELIEAARKKGVVLTAAPGQMLDPAHQAAKDLIRKGVFGKVCFARGQGSHPGHENVNTQGTDPTWYYRPGGGPVMDVAVYPLHSLTGLLGPVKRVTAFSGIVLPKRVWNGKTIDVQMADSTLMLLDFGEAVYAEVNGTFCRRAANSFQIELYGERGVVQLGGWMRLDIPLEVYTDGSVPGLPQGWSQPQGLKPLLKHTIADLAHFADCISDGLTPVNSAAHAAHVVEVIEKVYLAARTEQAQRVHSEF